MGIVIIKAKKIVQNIPQHYLLCTCPNCKKEIKIIDKGYSSIMVTCKCKQIIYMLKE